MPDHDQFDALQAPFQPAARELVRAAQGKEPDLLEVAEALNTRFKGGVVSLEAMLDAVHSRSHKRQASFRDASFNRLHRDALHKVSTQFGKSRDDQRLYREAVGACERGDSNAHELVRRFILSVLNAEVIEAKGGVKERLDRRGVVLDMALLEKALSPLLDTAAVLMLRRPRFKDLGLAAKSRREVDLYNENLLGAVE